MSKGQSFHSLEDFGKSQGFNNQKPKKNFNRDNRPSEDWIPIDLIFNRSPEKDNEFIDAVKNKVESNKEKITTSQLRNIFSTIKSLEYSEKNKTKINLLRVKFAYISGRSDKREMNEMKNLCEFLDKLILQIKDEKSWKEFKDFFEAIIAYHKFYGGKIK